jgi:PST family polysaccharide transporter
VNRGIIKYWSNNQVGDQEKQKILSAGIWLNILLYAGSVILLIVFSDYFLSVFHFHLSSTWIILLLLAGLFIYIINLFFLSVILSFQYIKPYAIITMAGAVLLTLFCLAGVRTGILEYSLILFLAGSAANIFFTIFFIIKHRMVKPVNMNMGIENLKKLGEFILMAASVLIFSKGVEFYARSLSISEFGLHHTGLWQAVVKMSDGYMMVFINTVGIIYYPQVSALILDTEQLRVYVRDVLKIVGILTLAGLVLIYIFRFPILHLLYSTDFYPAADLMPLQFLGDFLCIISYLLMYIISAQSRTREFIGLQALSAGFYILLIHWFMPFMDVITFPAAHAIRCAVYFSVLVILNRRLLF